MQKNKKTFTEWLLKHYLLVFRDEENLQVEFSFRVNYARLFLALFVLMLLLSLPVFFITRAYMVSNSRLSDLDSKGQLLQLAIQIDSLDLMLAENQQYYNNLSNVINGKVQYEQTEAPKNKDDKTNPSSTVTSLDELDPVDSLFRKEYEGELQEDQGSAQLFSGSQLHRLLLFPPLQGIVIKKHSLKEPHYGVDLAAPKNTPIKAIADGTVLSATWTQDAGFMIGIQHSNDLVSFYKHNSELLKKMGDFVKAGEVIAIIGNTGEQTDGPHLHLELWFQGSPVNPEYFISF